MTKFKCTSINIEKRMQIVEKKPVQVSSYSVKLEPVERTTWLSPINLKLEKNVFEFEKEYSLEEVQKLIK